MAASRQRHHRSARAGHLRTSGDSNNEPGACCMSQREQRHRRALTTLLTAAVLTAFGASAATHCVGVCPSLITQPPSGGAAAADAMG